VQQIRVKADQPEQELQRTLKRPEEQLHEHESVLTEAKLALSRTIDQDVLVEQIVATIVVQAGERAAEAPAARSARKKRIAACRLSTTGGRPDRMRVDL
jgi:hypothetical protein